MKKIVPTLISFLLLLSSMNLWSAVDSDFEIIKKRVTETSMKSLVNDLEIERLINTKKDDGTWPGINYEDVSREGFEHRYHLANMVELARAYKSKTSKYYNYIFFKTK